jgi:hypothetical protein
VLHRPGEVRFIAQSELDLSDIDNTMFPNEARWMAEGFSEKFQWLADALRDAADHAEDPDWPQMAREAGRSQQHRGALLAVPDSRDSG